MNDKILPYLKAYAALLGAICTGLLGTFTADTTVGQVLTVISVVATAVVTFAVPNIDVTGQHRDESVVDSEDAGNYFDGHGLEA